MQKQDRRILRTQQAIYQAFGSLLLKKDFQNITVNDISQSANINRSTFYLHFEDKYALLDAYLLDLLSFSDFMDMANAAKNRKEFFLTSLGAVYDCLTDHLLLFRRLFAEGNYAFSVKSLRKSLRMFFAHQKTFFSPKIAGAEDFTMYMRITGFIARIEWLVSHDQYQREQFIREGYDLISRLNFL